MSLSSKPEDYPAAVRFGFEKKSGSVEVSCERVSTGDRQPYEVDGTARFANSDEFKGKVIEVGMSPAAAEEEGRSFNATARQLRELGFTVKLQRKETPA